MVGCTCRLFKDSVRDWIAQGYVGSFYDAYSSGARKLFWKTVERQPLRKRVRCMVDGCLRTKYQGLYRYELPQ